MTLTTDSPKTRKRHWLARTAKVALLIGLLGTAANWRNIHMVATYNPIILAGQYDTPDSPAESRLQDLDYLARLTDYDRSFSPDERDAFQTMISQTAERADELSSAAFYLAISAAVALADNGHTNIDIGPLYREFPMIDIRLFGFADGYHIVEAAGDATSLVGHRVTHIDGRPVEDIVSDLGRYRGGNTVWRRNAAPSLMIVPSILFEAELAKSADRLTLTTQSPTGETVETNLTATRTAEEAAGDDWTHIDRPNEADRDLSVRDGAGMVTGSLTHNGYYIRTPTGFGTRERPLTQAYAETLEAIGPEALDYLVIDFRRNSGGDYNRAVAFARTAHETLKEDGTLYLVTGSDTFSAAIVTVAMLKHHSERETVIVGTPMGDREHFWAERGMDFTLPNSGWRIHYATAYHDWGGDCAAERYCYTLNRRHDDIAVGSLLPDVVIGETFEDHLSGREPVLSYVEAVQGADRNARLGPEAQTDLQP